MKIGLLHLSDIHFMDQKENSVLEQVKNIANAIANVEMEISQLLILISGDIAHSGISPQYDIARVFLTDLQNALLEHQHLPVSKIYAVPGNHDCDFSHASSGERLIIKGITENPESIDHEIIQELTKKQKEFREFISSYHNEADSVDELHPCLTRITDGDITLQLFNTSWISQLKEKQGALIFPLEDLSLDSKKSRSDIVISICHHPMSWFSESCRKKFSRELQNYSDIIITGHEHNSDFYSVVHKSGSSVEYIEGAVLQDSGAHHHSGFNYIVISPSESKYEIHSFELTDGHYESPLRFQSPFIRNKIRLQNIFYFTPEFEERLNDAGALFAHPRKAVLSLTDIYVPPYLRARELYGSLVKDKTSIQLDDELSYFDSVSHGVVIGADQCGKTALLKRLALKFIKLDKVPCLVKCSEIKTRKADNYFEEIKRNFKTQYPPNLFPQYNQLNKADRVLLLDDWHKLSCVERERGHLLALLDKFFGTIIISSDDTFDLEEFKSYKDIGDILGLFKKLDLQIFGRELRDKILEKWLTIEEYQLSTEDLGHIKAEYARQLDEVFETRLVPPFPINILIIIQQLTTQSNGAGVVHGSYGELYELLIEQGFYANMGSIELLVKKNFLEHLAYFMFKEKKQFLTREEMQQFHLNYCNYQKEFFDLIVILRELCNSFILMESAQVYSFKYQYFFYYFTAKHLAIKISKDQEVGEQVSNMVQHLYLDKNSNLLLFLAYLSDNREVVIDKVIELARTLYSEFSPCDFSKDVKFLCQLNQKPLELDIQSVDGKNSRESTLKCYDQIDETVNGTASTCSYCNVQQEEEEEEETELDEAAKQCVAFRTIDILGQILRNYSARFSGEYKDKIIKECYELSLRGVSWIAQLAEKDLDEITVTVHQALSERYPNLSAKDLELRAQRTIFTLITLVLLSFVKKLSATIGYEKLGIVYNDILKEVTEKNKDQELATRIIDLSIRLDSYKEFPINETFSLIPFGRDNICVDSITKFLVHQRFNMRPCRQRIKDKVTAKLNESQRILESPRMLIR
ncbi:metallophosphoesterase [Halodesulfovibrio aestuarii]|uniref:Metallophosphoesterase n=1 Tax=Halodesulfovibrio aestuarii TaxID=126333 RepID=A0ABV4JUC9_9BACT